MTTRFEEPRVASQMTKVADMPPLDVVTEGIPEAEHIDQIAWAKADREGRGRMVAWALAGVIGFVLVVAGILALTQYPSTRTADLHLGVTPQAWQEFRAGERVSSTPFHLGLPLPAWQAFRAGERASTPRYTGRLLGEFPIITVPTIPAL